MDMLESQCIGVCIVGNPSLSIDEKIINFSQEWFVNSHKLMTEVASFCNGRPHRIYWRVTELDYRPISGYIELKAALNMMLEPRFYVILDEPSFMFTDFSEENFDNEETRAAYRGPITSSNVENNDDSDSNFEYDVSSLLREREDSSECKLTDLEILMCAMGCRQTDAARFENDCLMAKTGPIFTKENEQINKQIDILMKGFPEARATLRVEIPFAETKKISSAGTSSAGGARKKSDEFKIGNDVREFDGQGPNRNESKLDEITNTWRDVKRALSLLCVKTFSSNAAMLEAPPGSREDLVEAARTPCTPTVQLKLYARDIHSLGIFARVSSTESAMEELRPEGTALSITETSAPDLDTMLYGYTNRIYVLDHTPESLPDMDMLRLFASPAGRALVTGDNTTTRRGGSTTSSLSRESSSRAKSARRMSSMVSLPTPPPRQRKSSDELYKEAVEILGLTCSLTDSCRCLDCQSNYFDYEDDCGDARSELAAGTPILLDHALSHPLTCSIQ